MNSNSDQAYTRGVRRTLLLVGLALAALLAGLGAGLGLGVVGFSHTTTKTVLVEREPATSAERLHTLRVQAIDQAPTKDTLGIGDTTVNDCSEDARLPRIGSVEVRAPGNGLTEGELLGIPNLNSARYAWIGGTACILTFNVPELADSRFYVLTGDTQYGSSVASQFSRAAAERAGWIVRLRVSE